MGALLSTRATAFLQSNRTGNPIPNPIRSQFRSDFASDLREEKFTELNMWLGSLEFSPYEALDILKLVAEDQRAQ